MIRPLFRIIDANFNRSREGLRVCEELARFVLNSPRLTSELKAVRHSISDITRSHRASASLLCDARDAAEDVGRVSHIPTEMRRAGYSDVCAANMQRVEESLRVLEEFLKLVDADASAECSRLRFKVYDIEKKLIKKLQHYKGKS